MKAIAKLMDPFSKFNGGLLGNLSEILSATKVLLENIFFLNPNMMSILIYPYMSKYFFHVCICIYFQTCSDLIMLDIV